MMTQEEAIEAMKNGDKVTHWTWAIGRWIAMIDGTNSNEKFILSESGVSTPVEDYWNNINKLSPSSRGFGWYCFRDFCFSGNIGEGVIASPEEHMVCTYLNQLEDLIKAVNRKIIQIYSASAGNVAIDIGVVNIQPTACGDHTISQLKYGKRKLKSLKYEY